MARRSSSDFIGSSGRLISFLGRCSVILLLGCEENLPPRNDPQGYLEALLQGEEGTVVISDSTVVSQLPGTFLVSVKNLYDEVLQSEEDISIDINFWIDGNQGTSGTAHGDRNNLLNSMMIQYGNLLTIEPESSATFLIGWDQIAERFWDFTNLSFMSHPGNPCDFCSFESGSITLVATGTARFFKNVAPVDLGETRFVITYIFTIPCCPQPAEIDKLQAKFDSASSAVVLSWLTTSEVNNAGWIMQRGTDGIEFPDILSELISGQGSTGDTTYYTFVDSFNVAQGSSYYRLENWYDFEFVKWPIGFSDSVSVFVPK